MVISADYYSCTDTDELHFDTVESAVEDYLDGREASTWPAELIVMGYVEDDECEPCADEVYFHDEDYDVTVDVVSWVREHRPHWLENSEVVEALKILEGDE
jgi:hypothetical protein